MTSTEGGRWTMNHQTWHWTRVPKSTIAKVGDNHMALDVSNVQWTRHQMNTIPMVSNN